MENNRKIRIKLYNLHDNYHSGKYWMYHKDFDKCSFIDTYPSYRLRCGAGRIIMFQWNEFLRKIKHYLWQKNKNKKIINKFWKKTRTKTLNKYRPYLPNEVIQNINSFM
jgi:hypothetical protein